MSDSVDASMHHAATSLTGPVAAGVLRGVPPLAPAPELKVEAPALYIHLHKVKENARLLVEEGRKRGIRVMGVTKAVRADPAVAHAMLAGGVTELADSRLPNLRRLREAGIRVPLWLLRLPQVSLARETVALADGSLNSELATLRALSQAARSMGRTHQVMLMVDLGDRREGLLPEDVVPLAREVAALPGLRLNGLGTNLTCFAGVCPSVQNLGRLVELARQVEQATGVTLETVSGGNSSSLLLMQAQQVPPGINHLRLGESILLGRETTARQAIPGAHLTCFQLEAEVIELKRKPSLPEGEVATDAFGQVPVLTDRGVHSRAICAVGRQDVVPDGLEPLRPGVDVLGGSSDHLLLDVERAATFVGDRIRFVPNYGALLAAMTSPYVAKVILP